MDFEKKMPEWENEGTEPSAELKTNGFQGGYKPPAGIFNWFWSLITNAIKEIQENLSNVDNTKDSEKNVAFASEANVGRKVKYPFIFRLNGGGTEGTDLWTYDGSTSRSVNLTPEKLGARPTDKPNIVVNAVREVTDDGKEIYTATDSNITELYDGLEITVIPNETNESLQPRLAINDLGDKGIRMALSFNCAATNALKTNFIQANRPFTLKYHANCNLGIQGQGAWIFADRLKVSAQDLYGTVPLESGGTGVGEKKQGAFYVAEDEDGELKGNYGNLPIDKGGTGASTKEEALENLGALPIEAGNIELLYEYNTGETMLTVGKTLTIPKLKYHSVFIIHLGNASVSTPILAVRDKDGNLQGHGFDFFGGSLYEVYVSLNLVTYSNSDTSYASYKSCIQKTHNVENNTFEIEEDPEGYMGDFIKAIYGVGKQEWV